MQDNAEFGPYQLEGELGSGGMGVVYRAIDRRVPRTVALKILHPAMAVDPVYRERFRRESAMLSAVEHPHIVPLYNTGEIDDRLYLDMRFIDGDDLSAALDRRGAMPAQRAVSMIDGLADALDLVHKRGVLHRDIKPHNVMLAGERFFPYLLDFGIARSESESGLTQSGTVAGSLEYMAPERFEGRTADRRSDLYSLTGVLVAALTGRSPYPERSGYLALAHAHCEAPPPRPSDTDPALAPFDAVVAVGMAKDPAARFPSAAALTDAAAEALRHVDQIQGVVTRRWNPRPDGSPAPHYPPRSEPPAPAPAWVPSAATPSAAQAAPTPAAEWTTTSHSIPRRTARLPWIAWLIPVAAVLAVIGSVLTWFRASISLDTVVSRAPNGLSAWGDGKVGVLVPILLGAVAIRVVLLLIGRGGATTSTGSDPARSTGRIVLIVGAVCLLVLLTAWFLLPSNYRVPATDWYFGVSWSDMQHTVKEEHAALSRGVQPGYFLTIAGAALATLLGAALMSMAPAGRSETVSRPDTVDHRPTG